MMDTKTRVINILGGPGVGKSTIATGLYSLMMQKRISCELASEYAKDIVWEEHDFLFNNQIILFAEQFRRIYRLLDKVDYIITDSPLLLNAIYLKFFYERTEKKYFDPEYTYLQEQFFLETFEQFRNLNFYIERNAKYHHTMRGRVHTLEESKQVDKEILNALLVYDPDHYICNGSSDQIITEIYSVITEGYNE